MIKRFVSWVSSGPLLSPFCLSAKGRGVTSRSDRTVIEPETLIKPYFTIGQGRHVWMPSTRVWYSPTCCRWRPALVLSCSRSLSLSSSPFPSSWAHNWMDMWEPQVFPSSLLSQDEHVVWGCMRMLVPRFKMGGVRREGWLGPPSSVSRYKPSFMPSPCLSLNSYKGFAGGDY